MLMRAAPWSSAQDDEAGFMGPWGTAAEVALEFSRQQQGAARADFEALASALLAHSLVLAGEARAAWSSGGVRNIGLRDVCREGAGPPAEF